MVVQIPLLSSKNYHTRQFVNIILLCVWKMFFVICYVYNVVH